jgi:predicted nucleic acid-binding protein
MIHLDTGFLIRALLAGSPESEQMERWLGDGEPIHVSAVAWTEFLCGPVAGADVERAERLFDQPVPLASAEAIGAARLFQVGGRRRHSLPDCMIAATAIRAEAELATTNAHDFSRFTGQGLRLAWPRSPTR